MAGFWEGLMGGGTAMAGYGHLMGELGDQQDKYSGQMTDMMGQIEGKTQFQPWGVKSGLGSTNYGPDGMSMDLSDTQQGYANQQGQGASDMFNLAMQDNSARETDIYNQIRAMQMPGEERQYDSMNSSMFGSGRGGMSSAAYGGSPEQHAFALAQGEAQNQAAFGAMAQGQTEMMNQANIGNQMFQNQYMPWQQQMQQGQMGMNNAQLAQNSQLQGANMWAQMGLGNMTNNMNYDNIKGNAFGNMINGMGGIMGGVGGMIDDGGGLWNWVQQNLGL